MRNLFVTDPKLEIGPQIVPALHKLGIKTLCINPEGAFLDRGCTPANLNVNECIIDAVWSADPKVRSLSTVFLRDTLDIVTSPPNEQTSGGSAFFKTSGRDIHQIVRALNILKMPEIATPGLEYRILSDQKHTHEVLKEAAAYNQGNDTDPFVNDMRRMASSALEVIAAKIEYFPQFLKVPLDGLRCFEDTGHLSEMGEFAVERISDIRREPVAIICMTPLHLLEHYKVFLSLVAYNVFSACTVQPIGYPVHAIFDEFIAMQIPSIDTKLNTLRGMKFTSEIYVQNKAGITKNYDELTTEQIYANCDIKQFMAVDTLKEATEVSDMIGTKTIRTSSASVSKDGFEHISQTLQDTKIPILSPTEVMALPAGDQIIKVRGMKPIRAKTIPYWEIEGLRELVAENPLEGPTPNVKPKAKLKISGNDVKVIYPKVPRKLKPAKTTTSKTGTSRHLYFLWAYAWIAIVAIYQVAALQEQLPALRTEANYRDTGGFRSYISCDYIALNGERFTKFSDYCPVITFQYARGEQ